MACNLHANKVPVHKHSTHLPVLDVVGQMYPSLMRSSSICIAATCPGSTCHVGCIRPPSCLSQVLQLALAELRTSCHLTPVLTALPQRLLQRCTALMPHTHKLIMPRTHWVAAAAVQGLHGQVRQGPKMRPLLQVVAAVAVSVAAAGAMMCSRSTISMGVTPAAVAECAEGRWEPAGMPSASTDIDTDMRRAAAAMAAAAAVGALLSTPPLPCGAVNASSSSGSSSAASRCLLP